VTLAALLLGAYLLGGVPFAYLFVRATKGVDVRKTGSGNMGATNASRLFPARWRLSVFLFLFGLDAGKGFCAARLLPLPFALPEYAPALAAAAAVVGHIFTPYLGFRGGKGVATTIGALLGLAPLATIASLGVFTAVYLPTRVVGLGSVGFALALPLFVRLLDGPPGVFPLACGLAVLIVVRHRSNLARVLSGAAP
jgi:glycerol-3-phosphate acyltransferase PlsY